MITSMYVVNSLQVGIQSSTGLLWRWFEELIFFFLVESIAHWYLLIYKPSMQDIARHG